MPIVGSEAAAATYEDRWLSFGSGAALVPERLLRAHARGEVLFVTGAGTSRASGLPDFKGLVLEAYRQLDGPLFASVSHALGNGGVATPQVPPLSHKQSAEVTRFLASDYDVALGMLERRVDGATGASTKVRDKVCEILRNIKDAHGHTSPPKPSQIHRSLVRLAERGGATTIVTTNFDRLLQAAAPRKGRRVRTHALGAIPRPGRGSAFAGVLHIHGVLSLDPTELSDVVVTDQDFGEFYLRRRVVPDFIYDAARLFHLVLVGYSANDAPMRYLLNAVAADGSRFDDLKERFAFVGMPVPNNEVTIEDWKGRGITPIPYDDSGDHSQLGTTLSRWAELSPLNGAPRKIDTLVRRIVRQPRSSVTQGERDLVDHIFRRSAFNERLRLAGLASDAGADADWLGAIAGIGSEADKGTI